MDGKATVSDVENFPDIRSADRYDHRTRLGGSGNYNTFIVNHKSVSDAAQDLRVGDKLLPSEVAAVQAVQVAAVGHGKAQIMHRPAVTINQGLREPASRQGGKRWLRLHTALLQSWTGRTTSVSPVRRRPPRSTLVNTPWVGMMHSPMV